MMIIITLLSIITALLVVTSTSTVYSVLWLVSTFLIISVLLAFLNLGFTALLYIIVYVGAIAILFLFVVQLLDLGSLTEQPHSNEHNIVSKAITGLPYGITPLALVISLSLVSILILTFALTVYDNSLNNITNTDLQLNSKIQTLFYNNLNLDISSILSTSIKIDNYSLLSQPAIVSSSNGNSLQVQSLANWLYGPGLLPLIIVSVILLISMIAPIYLCKDDN